MSEITFGGKDNFSSHRYSMGSINEETAIFRAVPTDESIAADILDNLEINESATPKNRRKLSEIKVSRSKGKERKYRKTLGSSELDTSEVSGILDKSMNFSSVQNAILLPNRNQSLSNIADCSTNNNISNNLTLFSHHVTTNVDTLSNESPQLNNQNAVNKMQVPLNIHTSDYDISNSSESQLNSTYTTSETSYLSDTSSSQSSLSSEGMDQLIQNMPSSSINNSTMKINQKRGTNMPIIEEVEEPKQKQKKQTKNNGKKKADRAEPKTKSKGTQVNIKTRAVKVLNNNPKQKKPRERKNEDKIEKKQINKQKNEIVSNTTIDSNNINIAKTDLNSSNVEKQLKEKLLEEKIVNLLDMPGTSHENSNQSIIVSEQIQPPTDIVVSNSCSIKIVRDANNAQKISIVLPPDTALSVSKENIVSHECNILPHEIIQLKQENSSTQIIDLTSDNEPVKIKQEKEYNKKDQGKNPKSHKSQQEEKRTYLNKKGPQNRQKITCKNLIVH